MHVVPLHCPPLCLAPYSKRPRSKVCRRADVSATLAGRLRCWKAQHRLRQPAAAQSDMRKRLLISRALAGRHLRRPLSSTANTHLSKEVPRNAPAREHMTRKIVDAHSVDGTGSNTQPTPRTQMQRARYCRANTLVGFKCAGTRWHTYKAYLEGIHIRHTYKQ